MKAIAIEVNDKYNSLTAIERVEAPGKFGVHWKFSCDCGNFIMERVSRVVSGTRKSCGCATRLDHPPKGTRYGVLKVVAIVSGRSGGSTMAICECEGDKKYKCTGKATVALKYLLKGRTTSCGCEKRRLINEKRSKYVSLYGIVVSLIELERLVGHSGKWTRTKLKNGWTPEEILARKRLTESDE